MLLECVELDDKNRHLFVVDIKFNKEEAAPKQYMYSEKNCLIFEKKEIPDATERYVFQLSETLQDGDKSYLCTKKTHASVLEKQFTLPYLEHLAFLIIRAGWRVILTALSSREDSNETLF